MADQHDGKRTQTVSGKFFHLPFLVLSGTLAKLYFTGIFVFCQTLQCHNKTANDFVFVGSSSLIATAGLSTDNR